MNFIYLVLGMIPFMCFGCNCRNSVCKKPVEISVDSVFVNYYKEKESNEPMYIFFHFTINNLSNDTININLPWSEFDKLSNEHSEFFGVYQKDTIKFYSGNYTPQSFRIYPGENKKVDFQYGSSNGLMNLYKVKFKRNFKKEQDFMFDVANESELFFKINNLTNKDLPIKRKIVFRDPEDVDEHTWK